MTVSDDPDTNNPDHPAANHTAEHFHAASAGLTVPLMLARNAEEHGDWPALSTLGADSVTLTWAELRQRSAEFSEGLVALGLEPGDRMLTMMSSRFEHWIADYGAQHARAIPCTAYGTLASDQIGFVAAHSAAPIVVLEGHDEVRRWQPVLKDLPDLETVIVVEEDALLSGDAAEGKRFLPFSAVLAIGKERLESNPSVFEHRWQQIVPEDPVGMMYTSGTTGDPKGVVLSHHNVIYQAISVDTLVPVPVGSEGIAYLPLAHIAERMLSLYGSVYKVVHIYLCPDPKQIAPALGQVRPHWLFGVPRVWEKLAAGVQAVLKTVEPERKAAFDKAHALMLEAVELRMAGKEVPDDLAAQVAEADSTVLAPIRGLLGLDRLERASSGAAPISVETLRFLHGLGIKVMEVWGMSETSGAATVCTATHNKVGTVGITVPGNEIRIAEDGEILVRGPLNLLGYLRADGTVESPLDEDGWLATGDVGVFDDEGFLSITDRKKELLITSSGKNIAPTLIESHLTAHPTIGFAAAIGDNHPYITALIVLDPDVVSVEAAESPEVLAAVEQAVAAANHKLSRIEQVKKYRILPGPWTPDTGEVTPKLSLRRRVILDRYADIIGEMYAEPAEESA